MLLERALAFIAAALFTLKRWHRLTQQWLGNKGLYPRQFFTWLAQLLVKMALPGAWARVIMNDEI